MTRRQYFGALLVLSVSGLIGGALSVWLLPGRVAWAQEPAGRELRAESFVLVDANGQTRGSLSLSETGQPTLVLNDEALNPRAGIALEGGDPTLWFRDAEGRLRTEFFLLQGEPNLGLYDGETEAAAGLAVWRGQPQVWTMDADGVPRGGITVHDGDPRLWLADAEGNDRVQVGFWPDSAGMVGLDVGGAKEWSVP